MDGQAITKKSDLERILLDRSMEAKAKRLSFSLLESITKSFSDEQQIGRGGFAVVYKGLLEYGEVAVKKLTQNCIDDEEKFIEEVRCLMKAKHKNIVRFLGYCSDTQGEMVDNNGQFVMADVRQRLLCFEYVPKGTLHEYIKDASREWRECYKIIKGVCEGLHYLHYTERIVHRDLKPANILLANDMVPKITDFGISRCFGELQTHHFTSKPTGSLGYLAPELLHNNGKITFKSDIYSLGIIIIEMLTGRKRCPEVEEVQKEWRHKLEGSQKELQLEQIRVCTEVAQSCLEYKPEKRPSVQTIIDTLEQTEIEELCIEPGASSQNPRETMARRRRNIEMLMQAISKLYTGEKKHWSFQDLYSDVYHLVVDNKGEELYSAAETTMASEVQRLCGALDDAAAPADSTLFLQELLTRWDRHIWALRLISDAFMYMDNFVLSRGKTPMFELGLHLWRDEMSRSDKIRPRLIEAVKRQKGGEDEPVPGVNKMLTVLGADVNMPFLCFGDGTEALARTMEMLMQTISKFYARDFKDLVLGCEEDTMTNEELRSGVYNLVLHNKGEELYSAAETTMAAEVHRLYEPLDDSAAPVDSALFLQELLDKWEHHCWALRRIRDTFKYMDGVFVAKNGKTPLYELALRLWRDEMARSDKICPRLIEEVKRQKRGEHELVPGVNKMLTMLGADFTVRYG